MLSYPDFSYKQVAIHIAGGQGEIVRFRADNILIYNQDDEVIFQHSCHKLFALFIIGETRLTSVIIRKAVTYAFPIILLSRNFHVVGRFNCSAEGNTILREKQYINVRSLDIAKALIIQKVSNQRMLLQQLRAPSREDIHAVQVLSDIASIQQAKDIYEIMGYEGAASSAFFKSYFRPLHWTRREPRCKRDIYNLLLDIGYTYLFNYIETLLSLYGFDLYKGVLHTCFYQRKSLVCDIVEPFRCIIDRRLRKAHNLNQIHEEDFFFKDNQWHLAYKDQARYTKLFFKDLMEEKAAIFKFCQAYYRWFMTDKPMESFPKYSPFRKEY